MPQVDKEVAHTVPHKLVHQLAKDIIAGNITIDAAIAKVGRAGLNGAEAPLIATLNELRAHHARARSPKAKNRITDKLLRKHPQPVTASDYH